MFNKSLEITTFFGRDFIVMKFKAITKKSDMDHRQQQMAETVTPFITFSSGTSKGKKRKETGMYGSAREQVKRHCCENNYVGLTCNWH